MRSCSRVGWRPVDEKRGGFGWIEDARSARTSHALLVGGRVWLIDPFDVPGLEDRVRALGPPGGVLQLLDRHNGATARSGRRGLASSIPRLGGARCGAVRGAPVRCATGWWREVALWEPGARTLVCADALGTLLVLSRAAASRSALHPFVRLAPPRPLLRVEPERVLVGHGAGLDDAAPRRGAEAIATARRRLPRAWLAAVSAVRSVRAASR